MCVCGYDCLYEYLIYTYTYIDILCNIIYYLCINTNTIHILILYKNLYKIHIQNILFFKTKHKKYLFINKK